MKSIASRGQMFMLLFGLIVLLTAGAMLARGYFLGASEIKLAGVLGRIPKSFPNWTVQEQAVAESPEMKRAVAELLSYDEAVFRTFKKDALEVTIYAAYWKPRKYPARLVAQHTPEVCWPANGWKLQQADYNQTFALPDGQPALPVQEVLFDHTGRKQFVRYWHVTSGQLSGFASGPDSYSIFILDAFWRDVRVANAEQVFVRISSNRPWPEADAEPLVKEIFQALAPVLANAETTLPRKS